MNDFILAGKITRDAREFAKSIIKEGLNIYDFVSKIEDKIFSLGGRLAFPVNVSINEFAAHDTANYKGEECFESGQVVKVDLGAQVNGFVGDTAFTKEITTNEYSDLIKTSNEALNEALKVIKPGVELREIGSVIGSTINSFGFNPITNLGGHGVNQFDLHSDIFIPNFDNGNRKKLEEGQTIAVEPFATTGKGKVVNSNLVKIHALQQPRPTRLPSARAILSYVQKEFNTLPFAEHHLYKVFKPAEVKFGLRELIRNGSIHSYPLLREESNGIVSQAEHTLIVKDKIVITTK